MSYPLCQHIMASGVRCAAPARRGESYCYHHHTLTHLLPRRAIVWENYYAEKENGILGLPMPLLEDATSIQTGYMQVVYAVLRGHLDTGRARVALSALRAAARNLPAMKLERIEHVDANQQLPDDARHPEVESWPKEPSIGGSGAPGASAAGTAAAAVGAATATGAVAATDSSPMKKPVEGLKSTG